MTRFSADSAYYKDVLGPGTAVDRILIETRFARTGGLIDTDEPEHPKPRTPRTCEPATCHSVPLRGAKAVKNANVTGAKLRSRY